MFKIVVIILNFAGLATEQIFEFQDKSIANETLKRMRAENEKQTSVKIVPLYS